jgi:hypothetical protein
LVVGLVGRQVIWYNDIEDGFGMSRYGERGTVGDSLCNQGSLQPSCGTSSTRSTPSAAPYVPRTPVTSPFFPAYSAVRSAELGH